MSAFGNLPGAASSGPFGKPSGPSQTFGGMPVATFPSAFSGVLAASKPVAPAAPRPPAPDSDDNEEEEQSDEESFGDEGEEGLEDEETPDEEEEGEEVEEEGGEEEEEEGDEYEEPRSDEKEECEEAEVDAEGEEVEVETEEHAEAKVEEPNQDEGKFEVKGVSEGSNSASSPAGVFGRPLGFGGAFGGSSSVPSEAQPFAPKNTPIVPFPNPPPQIGPSTAMAAPTPSVRFDLKPAAVKPSNVSGLNSSPKQTAQKRERTADNDGDGGDDADTLSPELFNELMQGTTRFTDIKFTGKVPSRGSNNVSAPSILSFFERRPPTTEYDEKLDSLFSSGK
jgi:hypothetical protein